MVVITGQVPVGAIGTDAFQECDTIGITRSVTKHNELVTSAPDIPRAVREAFHIATTGRPGPVLLDIPKDIVDPKNPNSAMEWYWPDDAEVREGLPGYKPTTKGHPRKIREAAELILRSERPVIYAGGGILKARAAEALRELAELCDIHVVTTLMARGAFPDSHPLCLGMPGMHGNYTAVTSMQRSDLLIALGQPLRRPDHRQGRRVRPRRQDHPRRHRPGRARQGPPARRPDRRRLPPRHRGAGRRSSRACSPAARPSPSARPGSSTISGWQETYPLTYIQSEPGDALKPQFVLEQLRDNTPDDCIVASRRRPAPDVDVAVLEVRPPLHLGELRAASARWASPCRRPSAPRSAGPTPWCGPSTATAASR